LGGGWARFGGPVPPWPQPKTATDNYSNDLHSATNSVRRQRFTS